MFYCFTCCGWLSFLTGRLFRCLIWCVWSVAVRCCVYDWFWLVLFVGVLGFDGKGLV